jgi:hypothetical protein
MREGCVIIYPIMLDDEFEKNGRFVYIVCMVFKYVLGHRDIFGCDK